MIKKVCTTCKTEKEISEFAKKKSGKFGATSRCKSCNNEFNKQYYEDNKESFKQYYEYKKDFILEQSKEYRQKNKEKIKEYYENNKEKKKEYQENNKEKIKQNKKKYYENNKEKFLERQKEYQQKNKEGISERKKEWREKNKESISERMKGYYENNKEILLEKQKEYYKEKRKTDPLFKLTCNIRRLISISLKNGGYGKNTKTAEILGCDFEFFMQHIENQFEYWMTWENYGKYNGELNYGWDLDHIIPVSSVKTEDELIKLNHYTNLQPLCGYYNRHIKRCKY